MPQAAAHILIPLLLMSIIRDIYIKKTNKPFPLHYVVIAGIAGAIPDLDIAAFWILNFFGFTLQQVHRTFAHTIFVPLVFIILGMVFHNTNLHLCKIRKHTLHLNMIFYMLAFGSFIHLLLDGIFHGTITPLYPLSQFAIGLDLFGYLPPALEALASPSLDGALIILYLLYLEFRHKISDFI